MNDDNEAVFLCTTQANRALRLCAHSMCEKVRLECGRTTLSQSLHTQHHTYTQTHKLMCRLPNMMPELTWSLGSLCLYGCDHQPENGQSWLLGIALDVLLHLGPSAGALSWCTRFVQWSIYIRALWWYAAGLCCSWWMYTATGYGAWNEGVDGSGPNALMAKQITNWVSSIGF